MSVRIVLPGIAAVAYVVLNAPGTNAVAQTQPSPAPLMLNDKAHTPVAKSAARVVKTRDGQYTSVPLPRPAPRHPATVAKYAPVAVPPEAAQAFASAAAQVRVVTADELNDIDRAADAWPSGPAPIVPVAVTTTPQKPMAVAVVDALELNDIDRQAATVAAPQPEATAPGLSWKMRLRLAFYRVFAAFSAMAHALVG